MKRITIFLSLGFILAGAAFAFSVQEEPARWKLFAVSGSEASDDTRHYYDAQNLTHTAEGLIRVWEKTLYSTTEQVYKGHLVHWELDVAGRQARVLSATALLRDGNRKIPVQAVEYIPRGQILEQLLPHLLPMVSTKDN